MSRIRTTIALIALSGMGSLLLPSCSVEDLPQEQVAEADQAVIGGSNAAVGEFPWQAQLAVPGYSHWCGGSLVANRWVLTAGHCVDGLTAADFTVTLGERDRSVNEGREQTRSVSQIIRHPDFDYGTLTNDVALLQLSSAVTINTYVKTIDLAGVLDEGGTDAIISGWGNTAPGSGAATILQKAALPIVNDATCYSAMSSINGVKDSMVCAGFSDGIRGGCHGDSGGPLVVRGASGTYRLVGVVSWGRGYYCNTYTVFSRVRSFAPWVAKTIGNPSRPCSGRTMPGATDWQQYNSDGIYVDVDTSACDYSATPLYFTSIGGTSSQWTARGASAIYSATSNGFRIYVNSTGITPAQANAYNWHINWEGQADATRDPNLCTGKTPLATTNWQQYGTDGIYVDVSTSACGLTAAPRYVTSIEGAGNHWVSRGATSIYSPTATGFRVYVNFPGITVANAKSWNWHINWQAIPQASTACKGSTPSGTTAWQQYGTDGVYVDVSTSSCSLEKTPLYLTSIGGTSNHWTALGGTSVYSQTKNGFRIYLNYPGITPAVANSQMWVVNWKARP